jgi:endonuclease/exonuclease/phosphatase family metal-dependent hydrolase
MPRVLRVATYNVRDLLDDRDAAARVVRAVQPDVLCLQEVPRRLTTEFSLPAFARAAGLFRSGGRRGTGGTAVLTGLRVHVHATSHGRLPVRFPDRTRGYAAVHVSLPGSLPVGVASIHLSLSAAERRGHVRQVLAAVPDPAIIAGDLNEGPDGEVHRQLAARLRLVSDSRPTFPAGRPTSALDVIFASPEVTPAPARAAAPPLEADLVAGSDHRPAWADLCLPASGW